MTCPQIWLFLGLQEQKEWFEWQSFITLAHLFKGEKAYITGYKKTVFAHRKLKYVDSKWIASYHELQWCPEYQETAHKLAASSPDSKTLNYNVMWLSNSRDGLRLSGKEAQSTPSPQCKFVWQESLWWSSQMTEREPLKFHFREQTDCSTRMPILLYYPTVWSWDTTDREDVRNRLAPLLRTHCIDSFQSNVHLQTTGRT